jgi:hypothetical protein
MGKLSVNVRFFRFLLLSKASHLSVSGFTSPIIVDNDDFLGFFIPVFGTEYTVCYNGKLELQTYDHPSGLTGKRYEQGKHDGWDIFGWFDKECRLYLFEDGNYIVQAFRKAGFSNLVGDTIYLEHPDTTNPTYRDIYAHVSPNNTVKNAGFGLNFNAGGDLGTITGNHLHFEVIDQKTAKSIDPAQFWDKGTKTCTRCPPVPEPATMILFFSGIVGLVGLKRRFRG